MSVFALRVHSAGGEPGRVHIHFLWMLQLLENYLPEKKHESQLKKREKKEANLRAGLRREIQEDVERARASKGLDTDIS